MNRKEAWTVALDQEVKIQALMDSFYAILEMWGYPVGDWDKARHRRAQRVITIKMFLALWTEPARTWALKHWWWLKFMIDRKVNRKMYEERSKNLAKESRRVLDEILAEYKTITDKDKD